MDQEPPLEHATADQLGLAGEENLYTLFRQMSILPGYEFMERPGVMHHHAYPSNPMFKGAWATRLDDASADETIQDVTAWFRARQAPFAFWWVSNRTTPPNMADHLLTHGWRENIRGDPGMAVSLDGLNEDVTTPEGFHIERALTQRQLQDWAAVFSAANEVPAMMGKAWADATLRVGAERAPWELYIGYWNDAPVATSILRLGAGVAGLFGIGTLPSARGRGIGSAITLKPLLDARWQGYHYGVLFSSELGYSVYQRLGFRDVNCKVGRYLWVNS